MIKLPKIGRNEPCHCGSGLKYKRCCLEKDKLSMQDFDDASAAVSSAALQPADKMNAYSQIAWSSEELHSIIDEKIGWGKPGYTELAHQIVDHMKAAYTTQQIVEAVSLWKEYANLAKPVIRKPGAYCAAVEYFIREAYELKQSPQELAAKHDVTAATVTKRYQELLAFTQEHFPEE
jgi:hypothetical protein